MKNSNNTSYNAPSPAPTVEVTPTAATSPTPTPIPVSSSADITTLLNELNTTDTTAMQTEYNQALSESSNL